jgi:glucosamine 6-phosphate synthetase-like amidotransferase/phosphosugar isomerase protein
MFAPGEAGAPIAVQAFEASLVMLLGRRGIVIGISHEGGTWATNKALDDAGMRGATVGLITAAGGSPGATVSDIVVDTREMDQSWCHTVGYVSPILAGAFIGWALAAGNEALGSPLDPMDPEAVRTLLATGLTAKSIASIEGMASQLATCDRVIVVGSGVDRIAARELVLKIEEGTHIPAAMRDIETLLHGHLAGMDDRTGLVAIAADGDPNWDERGRRISQLLRACRELGVRAGAIVTSGEWADYDAAIDRSLTPAGRVVIPRGYGSVAGVGGALLATAIPLQLLTERMARARGVNPDPIRRDDPAYLRAAEAADPET